MAGPGAGEWPQRRRSEAAQHAEHQHTGRVSFDTPGAAVQRACSLSGGRLPLGRRASSVACAGGHAGRCTADAGLAGLVNTDGLRAAVADLLAGSTLPALTTVKSSVISKFARPDVLA
jgi:hypothetical protein